MSQGSATADAVLTPPIAPARFWTITLLAGVLAGLAAWGAGEAALDWFRPPERWVDTMGYKSLRPTDRDSLVAGVKNALLAYGLLTVVMAAMLGAAGGVARGNIRAGLLGAGAGSVLGLATTTLLTIPAMLFYRRHFGDNALTEELLVPFAVHAASWSGAGIAGGLALARGAGGDRASLIRGALGGLIGAIVGAAVFEFAGAALFPLDGTTFPISTTALSRLTARGTVAVFAALFAARLFPAGRPLGGDPPEAVRGAEAAVPPP